MSSLLRIIVTGLIAQHPHLGGVTWDYLQYFLGLARLGHDVYYFEDSGEWTYNLDGGASGNDWIAYDPSVNVKHLAQVMKRYDSADKWAYHFPIKSRWYGLSPKKRREVIKTADLLINVSGTLKRPQNYRRIPRLIYIDSDPVFTQVKLKLPQGQKKFQKRLAAHDVFFSFGECLPANAPLTEYFWRPTRQPIVLSEWSSQPTTHRDVYTTVMSWTSYKPLSYSRQIYGQKDIEFKRFLELPKKASPAQLEVALGNVQHIDWERIGRDASPAIRKLLRNSAHLSPRDLLIQTGWQVADATKVSRDLDSYRHYIQSSKAEWSVAKNGYVVGQSGWFSCRSACYLAAGKPVIVQDTGFSKVLPVGEGILPFNTVEEAIAALCEIEANYEKHAKAARDIAAECFDSSKVLVRFIDQAMNKRSFQPRKEVCA